MKFEIGLLEDNKDFSEIIKATLELPLASELPPYIKLDNGVCFKFSHLILDGRSLYVQVENEN